MAAAACATPAAPLSPAPRHPSRAPSLLLVPSAALPRFLAAHGLPSPESRDPIPADASAIPRPSDAPRKRVRFFEHVLVRQTWHPEDYDRTPGEDSVGAWMAWKAGFGGAVWQDPQREAAPELVAQS